MDDVRDLYGELTKITNRHNAEITHAWLTKIAQSKHRLDA